MSRKFTRAVVYDRGGLGWSDPSPKPRTAAAMVEELHTLLGRAQIEPPYVLVGQSFAGLLVRLFAYTYPDEMAGLVLDVGTDFHRSPRPGVPAGRSSVETLTLCHKILRRTTMIGYIVLSVLFAYFLAMFAHAELFACKVEKKYPPRGRFVTVEGIKLHYIEKGSGRLIVLLHGDSGSSYDFIISPLLDKLAEKYRVLAFDRPGLGYSQRPAKDGWSPVVQARLIHAAVKQLGIERPIVAGHSRGGATMFAWAINYPDDMAAGVGLAPAFLPGSFPPYRFVNIPILSDFLFYILLYPAERFGLTKITKQTLVIAFSPDRNPPADYVDQFWSFMLRRRHMKSGMSDQASGGVLTGQISAHYPTLRVPFVIVNGASDHNVPAAWAQQAEQILPRAKAVIIPNTGHELMFNQPDAIVRAVDLAWKMVDEK